MSIRTRERCWFYEIDDSSDQNGVIIISSLGTRVLRSGKIKMIGERSTESRRITGARAAK
jgi:hypothetical protein